MFDDVFNQIEFKMDRKDTEYCIEVEGSTANITC